MESRPVWRTSAAGVRITVPPDVMARISSSLRRTSALTSEPREFSSILAIFALIFVISLQSSCAKSNACDLKASYTNDANAAQNTAMVAFCTTNNITYSTHPSGILYQIITPGAASKPNLCETISMTYTGTLLNGTKFDAGTISYSLSQLIVG